MLITSVMALICTVGIAFYIRFLLALYKECEPRWLRFAKHLRPFSGSYSVPIPRAIDKSVVRQEAGKLTKITVDVLLESRKETL